MFYKHLRKVLLGIILSLILVSPICLLLITSNRIEQLEPLGYYFLSIGERKKGNEFLAAYEFFTYLSAFLIFLLIPFFHILNKFFYRNKSLLVLFTLVSFTSIAIIVSVLTHRLNFLPYLFIFFLPFSIFLLYRLYKDPSVMDQRDEEKPIEMAVQLTLLGLGLCLILVRPIDIHSGLHLVVYIFLLALILISSSLIERYKWNNFRFQKTVLVLLYTLNFVLILGTGREIWRNVKTLDRMPNVILLNEKTFFEEANPFFEFCDTDGGEVECRLVNFDGLFDHYDFVEATITIEREEAIDLLTSTNGTLELHVRGSEKDQKGVNYQLQRTEVLVDVVPVSNEQGFTYQVNLKEHLEEIHLEDYKFFYITLTFIDPKTNEALEIQFEDFISQYEFLLKRKD